MELTNYELVRYPSGQLILCKTGAGGQGFRDVVGVYTNEKDAQSALDRLLASNGRGAAQMGARSVRS